MLSRIAATLTSRAVYLAGGLVVVCLVVFMMWAQLTAPLTLRLPAPSPDGKYFAYFDLVQRGPHGEGNRYELIIAAPPGRLMARFVVDAGSILWSNAGHLAILNEKRDQVTLIVNAEGRFLVLPRVAIGPRAEPRWSPDGTKLAYVRPALRGEELAIYDLAQTQAFPVPLPPPIHLRRSVPLFWSPGGEQLFFLNTEGLDVIFERVNVQSGKLQVLGKGSLGWKNPGLGLPRMSPDGKKVYLPYPLHSVIDAASGEVVWKLPAEAVLLWSPWSADGRQLFYYLLKPSTRILAHDFAEQSDKVILAPAQSNGFLTLNGRAYFFRTLLGRQPGLGDWLKDQWGWQCVDLRAQSVQPLGRVELYPWEQTQGGWILAQRDDYYRTRFGLYDPSGRVFSEYMFPTGWEVLLRQIKSSSIILLTVTLYGLLAFFVYGKRPGSAPARALYKLSLVLMVLFAGFSAVGSAVSLSWRYSFLVFQADVVGRGWGLMGPLFWLLSRETLLLMFLFVALVPPALLHFTMVFPEGNQFLAGRKVLRPALYGGAFLPLLGVVGLFTLRGAAEALRAIMPVLIVIAGEVVVITALLALLHSYRHRPDRRAKDQVRWVAMSFALPVVGLGVLTLLNALANVYGRLLGKSSQQVPEIFNTTSLALLCLFTPLVIGYALVAHKLFDIQLLIRRAVRYSLMTFVVMVVYLLLVGGSSWAIAGSFQSPSQPVIILSTLLTAILVALARNRLQSFIDRTFDRAKYDFREALQSFARGLPNIIDRQTLATRMGDTVQKLMKCRRFYLFVLDRRTKRLRAQPVRQDRAADIAGVEFDPTEPLCRYLLESKRPFEVEVSACHPKLMPIYHSAAEQLRKLEAAVVLAMEGRGELLGLMVLGAKASGEFYNAEDLELLKTVAHQAAVAIENTELFEEVAQDRELRKELEVASEVQAQLFPQVVPRLAGCQIAGRCLPARSVSGDYYDFLELPGQRIGLAIADVSGKGMSASLLMANLQGLLRTQAPTAESLTELVRRINRQLYGSSRGTKYCTFFYGVYDEARRQLQFVNAGHNPPLVLDAAGVRFLEPTGPPLGLFPDAAHEARCQAVKPGTLAVLYSDGIIEAKNGQGESYGIDRLTSVVSRAGDLDAAGLVERVLRDVRDFSGGAPIEDDQTLVLLKVNAA